MKAIKTVCLLITIMFVCLSLNVSFAEYVETAGPMTIDQWQQLYKWVNENSDGQTVFPDWSTDYFAARPEDTTGATLNMATGTNAISEHFSEEEAWERRNDIHFDNSIYTDENGNRVGSITGLVTWDCEDTAQVIWQSKMEGEPIKIYVLDYTTGEVVASAEGTLPYAQWGTCEIDISDLKNGTYVIMSQQGDLVPTYSFIDVDKTKPEVEIKVDGSTVADGTVIPVELQPGETKSYTVTATFTDDGGSGLWALNNEKIDSTAFGYYGMVVSSKDAGVMSADTTNVGDARKESGFVQSHTFSQTVTLNSDSGIVTVSGSIQDRAGNETGFLITFEVNSLAEETRPNVWAVLGHSYNEISRDVPNPMGVIASSIYNDDKKIYDVSKGIPTNEFLDYLINTEKYLYKVGYGSYQVTSGVDDLTVRFSAEYYNGSWDTVEVPVDEEGEEVKEDHYEVSYVTKKEKGKNVLYRVTKSERTSTVTKTIPNVSKTWSGTVYHDVPKSSFWNLENGNLAAKHFYYPDYLSSGVMSYSGTKVQNPGTRSLDIKADKNRIGLNSTLNINCGLYDTYSEAKIIVDSKTQEDSYSKIDEQLRKAQVVNLSSFSSPWVSPDGGSLRITATSVSGGAWNPERTTLYKKDLISPSHHNGLYSDDNGSVNYEGMRFKVSSNDVIVHTPVVNNSNLKSSSNFINQLINKKTESDDFAYVQLDTDFTIFIPNTSDGIHYVDKPGYGKNRPYNSYQGKAENDTNKLTNNTNDKSIWGKLKDVQIPFDTYLKINNETVFIPKNKWVSDVIGLDKIKELESAKNASKPGVTFVFTVPVWVQEKEYTIKTRVVGENADSECIQYTQNFANINPLTYVATKEHKVEIIGKIYDLQINNTSDIDWINKVQGMKITPDRDYVIANEFPFGRTKGNINERSQNKNATYLYAPKVGYTVSFNFKTKGRKSNNIELNIAKDGFYFVSKANGKQAVPVDLYYKSADGSKWLKIGTDGTNNKLSVACTDTLLKVKPQELSDSNRIYPLELNGLRYNYSLKVNIGTFTNMKLPHSLRLAYNNMTEYMMDFGGEGLYKQPKAQIEANAKPVVTYEEYGFNPNENGSDVVTGSVGRWYAGYALPSTTVAVEKKTTNPASTSTLPGTQLKDGYILVGMNIKTKNTPDVKVIGGTDYLKYNGPRSINEATGKEQDTKVPEHDWDKPFDPNKPDSYKEVQFQNIPTKTKIPNNTVVAFETINAPTDLNTIITH